MDLKTATPSHAAAGINIELESPAKAYHSGYTTPLDSYNQRPVPLSSLDERLSKVDASCPPSQARLSVIPAADSPAAGKVANDGISTAADASAAAGEGGQASTLHNLGTWIVKNQKFLACLWSIGACERRVYSTRISSMS